jgi:DNA-binding XRE family transcriptional regulator
MVPDNTPHDVIRAVQLLERSGFRVSGKYNPGRDDYDDAITALRVKHRANVRSLLPKLQCFRNARHLTPQDLAEAIGVPPSLFVSWEAGHRFPPADLFSRWCELLGV